MAFQLDTNNNQKIVIERRKAQSKPNMYALVTCGRMNHQIAIPPGMTCDEVVEWLATNGYTDTRWTLSGLYQIK